MIEKTIQSQNRPLIFSPDFSGEDGEKTTIGIIGVLIVVIFLVILYKCGVGVDIDAFRDSQLWDALVDSGIDPNDFIN